MSLPAEIVDAHHHLWDLQAVSYPWLEARGVRRFFGDPTPIQRDYLAEDFRADWAGLPVVQSVHVQVGAAPEATLDETIWLDAHADGTSLPTAIVAFADLTAPDLESRLDAHVAASDRVRGVRQIVSRHPSEDAATGSIGLLDSPAFLGGLRAVATRKLSFDLQLSAPLLPRAAEVIAAVLDLDVALCHAGSPWDQSAEGLRQWRSGLERIAKLPRVSVKLSGLGMFNPGWKRDTLAPVVETVLDVFGPRRTMWGSNFPVDRLYRGYRELLETVASLVPAEMQDDVFAATARGFYHV